MTRRRQLLALFAALALLAAAAPGPAAARSRVLRVALPSPGDVTLMHVNFKRGVARSRRLPRYRRLTAGARRLLRRTNTAVVGSSVRVSRTRVAGTVVLLRRRGGRRAAAARTRSLRVVVDRAAASTVTQRNVLRRRAPRRAAASGVPNTAPCGEFDIFRILIGETTPQRNWSYGLYFNPWDGLEPLDPMDWMTMSPPWGYGLYCDIFDTDFMRMPDALGSDPPFNCGFMSTYIGAATDSEGNVLTEPSFNFGLRCDKTIDEAALTLYRGFAKFCQDSEDRPCQITSVRAERDTALFRYRVPAGVDWSATIRSDPPLQKGDRIEIIIDLVDDWKIRDDQVM